MGWGIVGGEDVVHSLVAHRTWFSPSDVRCISASVAEMLGGRVVPVAEALTADNDGMRLFVAMNYGGRGEIIDAARRFAAECGPEAGEAEFAQFLYAPHMRDPQLIIRTSGEQRISNFLLWQCAYAELHFSPRLWPDFTPEDLEAAIAEYGRRHRRFGGR